MGGERGKFGERVWWRVEIANKKKIFRLEELLRTAMLEKMEE
jgi:hypothetical protein